MLPEPANPMLRLWGVPTLDGPAPVHFTAERRFQLLALLALAQGQWVERDRAAALLWPEAPMADARRNLRKVLFTANALVGEGAIQAQGEALRWPVTTDLQAFEAQRRHEPFAALGWRRGPPLQGLDDPRNAAWAAWLAAERERLDQAWLATAHAQLQAAASPGARADLARQLLALDPLDEPAVAALMQAELAADRPALAEAEYRRYAAALSRELGIEPSDALRELLHPAAAARPPARVGANADADDGFIGRRTELRELHALLAQPDCRLLTLLGPGGMGKSSLARRALAMAAPDFAGQHWIDLQDLDDAQALLPRWAAQRGLKLPPTGDPLQALLGALPPGRTLLVLDNAEHLAALPALVQRLLEAAPGLVVLATSRSRLGLAAEWLLPLRGLALPDEDSRDAEAAASFDAVRLFERCALAVRPDFRLAEHLGDVLAIVDAVGGLPLAIRLAARWLRLLPAAVVAQDLLSSPELLQHAPGDAAAPAARPEHASLQAVLDGTWQLLAPAERAALAALAVFRGGFTAAAARAVAGASVPLLSSLANKSLLMADETGRFSLHPVVAADAAARAATMGELASTARQRHAEHFAGQLAELEPLLRTEQGRVVQAVRAEAANVRAAWHTAIALRRADLLRPMAPVLRGYAEFGGQILDGIAELRRALVLADDPAPHPLTEPVLARVRHGLAFLHYRAGELEVARTLAEAALEPARACGETMAVMSCHTTLNVCATARGDLAGARSHLEQALAVAQAVGDRYAQAILRGNLGVTAARQGQADEARQHYETALALTRETGDRNGTLVHLNNLAALLRREQQPLAALRLVEEGLALGRQHGLANMEPFLLLVLGQVQRDRGRPAEAAAALQQALERARAAALQQVWLSAELGLAELAIDAADGAGAAEALGRARRHLRFVVQRLRETGSTDAMRVDAAYHEACARVAEGRTAKGAEALAACIGHPAAGIEVRQDAGRALQALGLPAPAVADAEAVVRTVLDELMAGDRA